MDTLIMIPGLGSDGAVWSRTIAALPDVDCRVGDTLSDDTLAGMAARILAVAPPRFALAGVSMGGMVALEIMRTAPERVTRLALVDTNARPDTPEQTARRERTNAFVAAATDMRAVSAASLGALVHADAPQDVRDEIVGMSDRVSNLDYVRQNKAVMGRGDLRPILTTIQVPTIVVAGENDVMTPLDMSEEIRDGIAGAELHVIPHCGHLPPIEAPEAMAGLLRALLVR